MRDGPLKLSWRLQQLKPLYVHEGSPRPHTNTAKRPTHRMEAPIGGEKGANGGEGKGRVRTLPHVGPNAAAAGGKRKKAVTEQSRPQSPRQRKEIQRRGPWDITTRPRFDPGGCRHLCHETQWPDLTPVLRGGAGTGFGKEPLPDLSPAGEGEGEETILAHSSAHNQSSLRDPHVRQLISSPRAKTSRQQNRKEYKWRLPSSPYLQAGNRGTDPGHCSHTHPPLQTSAPATSSHH